MRAPIVEDGKKTASLVRRAHRAEHFAADVCGNGDGLPAAERKTLPRIFDLFGRGDRAHSNQVGGCGLELSITQWIVSAPDGTIQIESAPGQLTTVAVRMPLEAK